MSWNDLSMKDRASYIKLGIENGITDLDTIRGIYNKFALGGDTKDSSKYMYADSDTTDPNFTDLTPIGEGVYKNKFGKIVYDTTKVTPPKKDKSINDNWQTAYAKGVPSGTMSADMETMNAVTGGAFNLISPSQWAGAFGRGAYNNEWEKIPYYLLAGNNGIVTDNFAQEHPWYSMGANLLLDTATLGTAIAGKSGIQNGINNVKNLPKYALYKADQTFGNNFYYRDLRNFKSTLKAIRENRYIPFMRNRAALKRAYLQNTERLQQNFDDAFDFAKQVEANNTIPNDIESLYKTNSERWNSRSAGVDYRDYINKKPTVRFTPYKQFARKNPDAAAVFDSNKNEVILPATWDPFNPHVLIDTSTPNTKGILVHEVHHQFQNVIPRFRDLDMELPSNRPFGYHLHINSSRPEVTNVFGPLRANNGWEASVKEFQSEVAKSKYLLNNPANFDNQPLVNQDKMVDMLSRRFYINPKWTREMLHRQSVYGYAEGGPLKKSYKDFSTRLSKAWGNQDLSQDNYDYQKYYNDDPERAYRQLEAIEHGGKGHFDDDGKSGIYKTPNHATYPDLGANSWLNNDKIFNMSARQAVPENTDRVLDYLGSDLYYNRGATKVMYDGAYQLPEITVTPNGNYTELIPNELGTGWMYRKRAGRFDDFNYDYVDRYERNQKALGGNLFADGGKKATRYRSSSNIRKQISTWEGSTMRTNVPFDRMDTMFNQVLPEGALEKLSQEQLDGLYSFAYNVGTGRFKARTAPTLAKYLQGNATIEDVKGTMWASGDKKYRGLANRRKKERSMLGAYVPVQETIPMTTPLATPLDITPAVQPIIESNPVIQDSIEAPLLASNIEGQEESYYTPGFFDYVNYINQIRQPKQPKQRDRRIWLTI